MLKVGPGRIVSMRYIMKNSASDVVANILEDRPVKFLYGGGEILPELERPLTGLEPGQQISFSLSPEMSTDPGQTYYFDVIIDDVQWAPQDTGTAAAKIDADCGPGCQC